VQYAYKIFTKFVLFLNKCRKLQGWTLLLATTMITSICKPIHVSHQQEKIISKLFKELEHHSQKHCAHTHTHTQKLP